MTKDLLAAQRYAQALFEIGRELHKDDAMEAELESLSAALKKSPEIGKFLANPSLKPGDKRRFLQRLYQERPPKAGPPLAGNPPVYEILLNFFQVLFEKGRFYLIHDIAVSFKRIADEAKGQGTAEVHSASALKPEARKRITGRLETMAGYRIAVKSVVDPSLIGGVVVKIRNKVIDGSVKHRIHEIKKELTKIQSI